MAAPEGEFPLAILTDSQKQKVKQMFEGQLQGPVAVLLFHGDEEGPAAQFTAGAREIVSDLAALSEGRITLREVSLTGEAAEAARFKVTEGPALAMLDGEGRDQGLRFYGAPAGYEFMTLLDDLIDVSRGETRLAEATRSQIKGISQDVVIQVFSTPG
jgi:alkyl hydroperoxide reductase subunit AhpF